MPLRQRAHAICGQYSNQSNSQACLGVLPTATDFASTKSLPRIAVPFEQLRSSLMKFIVGTSRGNVTCMSLYLSIYPGRMEGPPSSLSSASSYTSYWYNPVGSSTAVLSAATGTGGAAYGISVNNSYTAV